MVDASVAVKWLLPEVHSAAALTLLNAATILHAPDLLYPEVANALWKRVRSGEIAVDKAKDLLAWLSTLPLTLHPSLPLILSATDIACRYDRTVYDSIYLALAVREGVALVTADRKLVSALTGTPMATSVLLVSDL